MPNESDDAYACRWCARRFVVVSLRVWHEATCPANPLNFNK
jgi:hypothetical protein